MSGRGTSTDTTGPRSRLERLRAGELTRPRGPLSNMTPDERLASVARAMFDRGELGGIGLGRPGAVARIISTKEMGTQTNSDLLHPTKKLNALAGTSGGEYLSFLKQVYGASNEGELVKKFQKELGLEPKGLYASPVKYRQATQIQRGLGISRDPCHFGNNLF